MGQNPVKRMLVLGGSGRTGQVVCRMAAAAGWQVWAPSHADCDLLYPEAVGQAVRASGADAVVNCAAISGLEACMDDRDTAFLLNASAPAAMARACQCTGARLVHLSTDYVLEGQREGLKPENTPCLPVNDYGESKLEGERLVASLLPHALILRVSWVCGNPDKPGFAESVVAKAAAGQALAAIDDKFSLPTDAADIARVILRLLPLPVGGVWHVCSSGQPLSWHGMARLALQAAVEYGLLPSLPEIGRQQVKEVSFFRAVRPAHTAMDNARLRGLGIPMPTAQECIRSVVQRFIRAKMMMPSGKDMGKFLV